MTSPAECFDCRRFRYPAARRVWEVGWCVLLGVVAGMSPSRAWPLDASSSLATAAALRLGGEAALAEAHLTPLEQRLFADAADGRLDEFTLLTAALVASGADSADVLQRYQERFDALAAEFSPGLAARCDRGLTEAVFDHLHRRILHGGYRIDCTDLRIALDDGRFNCVSASVLFQCLAERHDLAVFGLEMPGHAMSRVRLADGLLDVETTCSAWFRLMDDPKRQEQSVRETLGTASSPSRATSREVSGIGLVAMVYYNRGVDLLAAARYAEAAAANAKALTLDGESRTARGNLLATVNNWAISLGQTGRLDEAISLLEAGLALDPHYEPFALNYAHVRYQRGMLASEGGTAQDAAGSPPVLGAP